MKRSTKRNALALLVDGLLPVAIGVAIGVADDAPWWGTILCALAILFGWQLYGGFIRG